MMHPQNEFYLQQKEPVKSCLLAMHSLILTIDKNIHPAWKYGMPFFCYKEKMFCYLWIHKKNHLPYLGVVEGKRINHPDLLIEKRSRMKIVFIDPAKDLPVKTIQLILKQALALYTD